MIRVGVLFKGIGFSHRAAFRKRLDSGAFHMGWTPHSARMVFSLALVR